MGFLRRSISPPKRPSRRTVIIPAHNESECIGASVRSILDQVDRVIVVADNCTDDTVQVARDAGAEVFVTVNNTMRKAGAQNQVLESLVFPTLQDHDIVVSMDADVDMHPDFMANASRYFKNVKVGAVSSNHYVRPIVPETTGLIGVMQIAEYARDARYVGRKRGRVGCMSGMATAFRGAALKQIRARYGHVYDADNWAEDWKLTFSLRDAGWICLRPKDCLCTTQPVRTWKALYTQRERWGRGYFQSLCDFRLRRVTVGPWASVFWGAFQTTIWTLWTFVIILSVALTGKFTLPIWFVPILLVFMTERFVTARKAGWRACGLALLYVPEMVYSWVIVTATYVGMAKHLTGARGQWGGVQTDKPSD